MLDQPGACAPADGKARATCCSRAHWKHGFLASIAVLMLPASVAFAQSYPVKLVRIMTSPAGGASDRVSRLVAQALSGRLGQQVIVDNRPGMLAIEAAAKAAPDGHTLLVTSNLLWILPMLQTVRYEATRSFVPVVLAARTPNVVVVHPSVPARSVQELIAFARGRPGELNYSAGSPGSTPHLTGEMFKARTGIDLAHIPYKGAGPALTALIAGEVAVSFPGAGSAMPHLSAGRLRALGVTSANPSALLPGIPTVASTVPGFETVALYGVFAPAGTPTEIIERLNRETMREIAASPVRERFVASGLEPVENTPQQFAAMVGADASAMKKAIGDLGLAKH
jgi:tripartite-type tricarboxylate transporter receptor subunit TctC